MGEVTYPSEPLNATLYWDKERTSEGWLHFIDPEGKKAVIRVTKGSQGKDEHGQNVWHIEIAGDEAIVSPSIHFVGHWHSPNPVKFKLMSERS